MAELIDVPAGLAGVAVTDTEIGDVIGEQGYFHYRGRSAVELAATADFETVAGLVIDGTDRPLDGGRTLPAGVADLIAGAHALDVRTALSALGRALGLRPLVDLTPQERIADARRLAPAVATLVASVRHGRVVEPDPSLGHVADYLRMIGDGEPTAAQVEALAAYFVLTIDHGFNNSTFATRVVASTGTDLVACVLAGYCSLTGPSHGANIERIVDMYTSIGDPADAEAWLRTELAEGRRLQGFGHSVYRTTDPRLGPLRAHGAIVAPELHRVAVAVEEAGTRLLAGRRLAPNVDLHAAVVLAGSGIPSGWFTATFAAARVVGWCAHAIEQAASSKILRPAARYVGPPPDAELYS